MIEKIKAYLVVSVFCFVIQLQKEGFSCSCFYDTTFFKSGVFFLAATPSPPATTTPKKKEENVAQYAIHRFSNYCILLNNGVRIIRKNGKQFPGFWQEEDIVIVLAEKPEWWEFFTSGYQIKIINVSRNDNFFNNKGLLIFIIEAPDLVYDTYVKNNSLDIIPHIEEFKSDRKMLLKSESGSVENTVEVATKIPSDWKIDDLVMYVQSNCVDSDRWPYLLFHHKTHSFVRCKLIEPDTTTP